MIRSTYRGFGFSKYHLNVELEKIPMKRNRSSLDETVIRAQLAAELHNKRQCSYDTYECSHLSIDGYKYCSKHILSDKNSPYKQCTYIYQNNGKKCYLPAAKIDNKKEFNYCNEHAFKSNLSTNRKNSKCVPPSTAEAILNSLTHYIKPLKDSHNSDGDLNVTKSIDPFHIPTGLLVDIDATALSTAQCNEVLDLCSESESDVEASTYSSVWHDANADSSDNESIDSEEEDPLKHANVYTSEEVSLITRDKLVRLQSLYIEQYRYLQYLLKEKRRKYIQALKREKETCCNIYNQVHDNPKEQRLYSKLKQYKKYHRTYGSEAILAKKLRELRAKITDGVATKGGSYVKCLFTEGGVKCGERALPMAKHCRKHILEDAAQVLFKTCGKMIGGLECTTPVEAIFDDSPCQLHMDIPIIRAYDKPRKDSESDQDDTLELPPAFAVPNTGNVKSEMMDYSLPQEIPKMETLPTLLFEESADGMSFSHDNQNLDVTGSDNNDIDVTDTSDDVKDTPGNSGSVQETMEESSSVQEAKEDTGGSGVSFLADLCVLDESKLEELDKKWLNLGKVTAKETIEDVSHKVDGLEEEIVDTEAKIEPDQKPIEQGRIDSNKSDSTVEETNGNIGNESDHESYSKPASCEVEADDTTITNEQTVVEEEQQKEKEEEDMLGADGEDIKMVDENHEPENEKIDES